MAVRTTIEKSWCVRKGPGVGEVEWLRGVEHEVLKRQCSEHVNVGRATIGILLFAFVQRFGVLSGL